MQHSDDPLVLKVREAIEKAEPGWRYGVANWTIYRPMVPGETLLVVSTWDKPSRVPPELLMIKLFDVVTPEGGSKRLEWFRSGGAAHDGWRISEGDFGDESYVVTFGDGQRYEIHFRKGRIVAELSGDDGDAVRRFARIVEEQIPAT
jgi:hypothetical protein